MYLFKNGREALCICTVWTAFATALVVRSVQKPVILTDNYLINKLGSF